MRAVAALSAGLLVAAACSGGGSTSPSDGTGEAAQADDLPAEDDAPAGELTVLTYNVAGLPQEISEVNPEEHIPLISPLLNAYDVVLTQEDFDWWVPLLDSLDFANYHDRLRAEATHEHRSQPHPGPEAVGIDTATRPDLSVGDGLGYLSRLPFTGETRVPWQGCFGGLDTSDGGAGDCLSMKGFGMVTVTLAGDAPLDAGGAEGDITVDVYNLHAEAGSTDQDQRLRAEQFDQLAAFIEEHSAGQAVILGGDTNLDSDDDRPERAAADAEIWARFLDRTGLVDTCTELGCDDPHRIDRIAYRNGGGVTLQPTSYDVPQQRFQAPDGEDLSDHLPVVAGFAWRATSSASG
jgi:hypothetical protein